MYSSVKKFVKALPIIRTYIDHRRFAHFCSQEGFASHYGVFDSFNQARERCPPSREFNQRQLTDEYVKIRTQQLFTYDYAVIFWLDKAFSENSTTIFDIGGSVGVHYHAYKQVLDYPLKTTWSVFETPEVVKVGREIATRTGSLQLVFTDSLEMSQVEADIWISAGALHYIEDARPCRLLANCKKRPIHIIFNKLPVYSGEDFVTAQNIGNSSYAPAYVYNRSKFVNEIESMGYKLLDSWDVHERTFYLPGHPEKSFGNYSGMYFKALRDNP
jgi:putative methyltransferase (TIGR04325 family)